MELAGVSDGHCPSMKGEQYFAKQEATQPIRRIMETYRERREEGKERLAEYMKNWGK
jgi:dissimilatory sulfite reductase (desulfoviridin) alpha/beta subunit